MGRNILLLCCVVIISIGFSEGIARYQGIPRLFQNPPFSRKLGRELSVNAERHLLCDDVCKLRGHNPVYRFNGIGVRDIDHTQQKPDGVKRIVILGDSMTAGEGVPLEQTGFRQLQKFLDQYSSERWEVISLALAGLGTLEEIIMLEEYGLAYEPDIVIIQIYPNNDICDNSIEALFPCGEYLFRPYAVKERNGTLRRTTGQPIRNTLRHYSSLFVALEATFIKAKYSIKGPLHASMVVQIKNEQMLERRKNLPLDPLSYIHAREEDQLPFVKEGWEITELLLTQLSEELHKKDIAFVAYEIPPVWEVEHPADQWAEYIATLALPLVRGYGSERLRKLFQTLDRPFASLLGTFDKHRDEVLPYWDSHLNPNGHRIGANAVFELLKESGLVGVK